MPRRNTAPLVSVLAATLALSALHSNPKEVSREHSGGVSRSRLIRAPATASAIPRSWKTDPDTGLPLLDQKPEPHATPFQIEDEEECPAAGTGPDPEINIRKNRIDMANAWIPVKFEAVRDLQWPKSIKRYRKDWTGEQRKQIARFEGIPISIEGYLAKPENGYVKRGGKEHCNCQNGTSGMIDYHLSLVKEKDDEEKDCIVVEVTARIRSLHKQWDTATIGGLVREHKRVRISGWLLFDPYHPPHLGEFRATLWEIHPIMRIEVQQNGEWVDLDDMEDDE